MRVSGSEVSPLSWMLVSEGVGQVCVCSTAGSGAWPVVGLGGAGTLGRISCRGSLVRKR
jgi:hypothetical protein